MYGPTDVGDAEEQNKVNKMLSEEARQIRKRRRRAAEQEVPRHPHVDPNAPEGVSVQSNRQGCAFSVAPHRVPAQHPSCENFPSISDHFDAEQTGPESDDWSRKVQSIYSPVSSPKGENGDYNVDDCVDDEKPSATKDGGAHPHQLHDDDDGSTSGTSPTDLNTDSSHSGSNGDQTVDCKADQRPGRATVVPPSQELQQLPQPPPIQENRELTLRLLPGLRLQGCQVEDASLKMQSGGIVELHCKCSSPDCLFLDFTFPLRSSHDGILDKIVMCEWCNREDLPQPSITAPSIQRKHGVRCRPPRIRVEHCHVVYAELRLQTGENVRLQCKCDNPDCQYPNFNIPLPSQPDDVVTCPECDRQIDPLTQNATSSDDHEPGADEPSRQNGPNRESGIEHVAQERKFER